MTDNQRKATDILLALEEKISTLTQIVGMYDLNIKAILDRVNKIYTYVEGAENITQQTSSLEQKIVQPIQADQAILMEENPTGTRRASRSEAIKQIEPSSDKKVPVIQRVSDNTGKDIFMADVSILDGSNNTVLKTKTNAVGKWQAHLKPGPYKISIVKTDTATKKKIQADQDITVSDSNTTLILPVAVIKRS
jgi:hypothetical protein